MDAEKRQQIVQEISILKGLSSHENIVTFVTAATVDATTRFPILRTFVSAENFSDFSHFSSSYF
jgi:serine/threonine protein kinase